MLRAPAPLSKKLDESLIEEYARLEGQLNIEHRHGVLLHPESRGAYSGSSRSVGQELVRPSGAW